MRDTRLNVILGPSRGPLRPCWNHLGSIWRNENLQFTSGFPKVLLYLRYCSSLAVLFWQRLDSYRYLGPSWPVLGPSSGHLGPSCAHLGPSWDPLERSWNHLDPSWAHLGPLWPLSWPLLAPSWALLAPSWTHLGTNLGLLKAVLPNISAHVRKCTKTYRKTTLLASPTPLPVIRRGRGIFAHGPGFPPNPPSHASLRSAVRKLTKKTTSWPLASRAWPLPVT